MKLASRKVSLIITGGVIIAFIAYFFYNTEKFKPLLHVNIELLALIALADLAMIGMNGLFIKVILVPFKKSISFIESYYVSLISTIGNYFAPVGAGFAFRAVYLKKKHNLPYSEYISTLSGNYVLVFMVSSMLGLTALLLLSDKSSPQFVTLMFVFMFLLIVSLLLSFIKIPHVTVESIENNRIRRIAAIVYRVVSGWHKIATNKKLMLRLFGLTLINAVLSLVTIWLIVKSLNLDIAFPSLLLFSVLGTLSLFINITPANLGIKEAIYIFSSSVLGFSVSQIVLIALIDRAVLFLVLLGLWLIFIKIRKAGQEFNEADN